jgi:protocatechuate 3,4-dioxygenase beta subunit
MSTSGIAARLAPFMIAWACLTGAVSGDERRLEPTLETHTGPWYEPGAPELKSLWQPGESGKPLYLHGLVFSTDGAPLPGALVELWHTDSAGNYPPLRAALNTKRNGSFAIRTVLPGHHLGYRARHIHFFVTHPDFKPLVTRIYFLGDPNMDEALFPELAILLEQGTVEGETRLFGNVEFVLRPR